MSGLLEGRPVDLWFAPLKPGGFRSRSIYLSNFGILGGQKSELETHGNPRFLHF